MSQKKKKGLFSWLGFGGKSKENEITEPVKTDGEITNTSSESDTSSESATAPITDLELTVTDVSSNPLGDEVMGEQINNQLDNIPSEQLSTAQQASSIPDLENRSSDTLKDPLEPIILDTPTIDSLANEPASEIEASLFDSDTERDEESEQVTNEQSNANAFSINPSKTERLDDTKSTNIDALSLDLEAQTQEITSSLSNTQNMVIETATESVTQQPVKKGFFSRLKESLLKTKQNIGSGFLSLFTGKKIDATLFEELEEQLLIADVGVDTTNKIIKRLTEHATKNELKDASLLYGKLKEEMADILNPVSQPLETGSHKPFVILMVGVNGVGKTTTIGKLAKQFQAEGKSVMLAAGDTFRAAAVEQLQVWGERNDIPVIAQHTGADSASVLFDALEAAKARKVDILIADTAGRLQNKSHLMDELKKIVRVMRKQDPQAPHEIMLTLDACTGQNAISQAKLFNEAVGLTGLTLTKLDGTAKGGVIFALADQFSIPVRYIGVGEKIDDLRTFNATEFIDALFEH